MSDASCSCGQLRISCEGNPELVAICHCLDCQRRTGSAFGVQAFFRRDRVGAPIGTALRYTRQGESGHAVTFSFCGACGSTVFWEAEKRAGLVAVAVGAFAEPAFQTPSHSIWERRQHPWSAALARDVVEHAE